jgi:hypothetical protein
MMRQLPNLKAILASPSFDNIPRWDLIPLRQHPNELMALRQIYNDLHSDNMVSTIDNLLTSDLCCGTSYDTVNQICCQSFKQEFLIELLEIGCPMSDNTLSLYFEKLNPFADFKDSPRITRDIIHKGGIINSAKLAMNILMLMHYENHRDFSALPNLSYADFCQKAKETQSKTLALIKTALKADSTFANYDFLTEFNNDESMKHLLPDSYPLAIKYLCEDVQSVIREKITGMNFNYLLKLNLFRADDVQQDQDPQSFLPNELLVEISKYLSK